MSYFKTTMTRLPASLALVVALGLGAMAPAPVAAQTVQQMQDAFRADDFARAFQIANQLAPTGSSEAQNILGILYRHGEGIPQDAPRAVTFFEMAIAQNNSHAMYNLGDLYHDGEPGVPQDFARAEQLYNMAIAVDNNPGALNNLGVLLETQHNGVPDWPRIANLYQQAANANDRDAAVNLALLYLDGNGVPEDPVRARQIAQQQVDEAGFARAERLLGYLFELGLGGPQDTGRAIALYQAAAADGIGSAAVDLANMYQFGAPNLNTDLRLAAQWYRRGSDLGDADGSNELGLLLIDGEPTVPDNISEANAMFELAHLRGLNHGTRNLAISYWNGDGLPVDLNRARQLMEQAARTGLPDAQNDLGVMLEEGVGGPVDMLAARQEFFEAAQQGDALAGLNLSRNLMLPDVPQGNVSEGYAWCLWAIERADSAAQRSEFVDTCAQRSAGWSDQKRQSSQVRADQLLAQY